MQNTDIQKFPVKKLWDLCRDGVFAVPEIQREFVWDSKRAYSLLDSIYRQLPIGTLLVWETNSDRRHLLRHAQEVLPPHNGNSGKTWFLIDGQQRLSVLYRAMEGHQVRNYNGKILDFSKLCFSFDKRFGTRFIFAKRPLSKLHVPVPELLSSSWKRRIRHLSKSKRNEVGKCRRIISYYKVPVTFVKTHDLNEIRETFLRINSGGLRISTADRAFTLASRLNLRRLMNELRGGLPYGFSEIDPRILQSAMALMVGQKELGSKPVESAISKLERDEIQDGKLTKGFTRRWRHIELCIRKSVDYLVNEIGVANVDFMPSNNMLAVLAFFFHSNGARQPTSRQRLEINKWFWATAVGRRYAGRGYYPNVRDDLTFFEALGRRGNRKFFFHDLVFADEIRRSDYRTSSSLNTAFFLLLLHRRPRYLETGNRIPLERVAARANRKDKHHIFPRALLNRNGFSLREANSLCNICFVVAEENQSFGSNKPRIYLTDFRRLKHFPSVMKSHLIPHDAMSGLWEQRVRRGYKQFQKMRLDWICHEFNRAAGIRLFRRA
jgi:hypothetical protein